MTNTSSTITDLNQKLNERDKTLAFLRNENSILSAQVRALKQALFGRKSEKLTADDKNPQLILIELDPEEPVEEVKENDDEQKDPAPRGSKPKRGRRKLPDHFERLRVTIDLDKDAKICACGHERKCIGAEVSEVLERVPAHYYVCEYARNKYACQNPDCCLVLEGKPGSVLTAPAPDRMIPRSMVGPGLLAQIMTAKFVDGMPFYRVEAQLARDGFKLPRQTMSRWAQSVGERLEPLWNLLRQQIVEGKYLQMDETTVQVMKEDGRGNTQKSFMWVIRGGPPDIPITLYNYDPSRAASVAEKLLEGFEGIVQTDGYEGYSFLDRKSSTCVHAGCLTHARRKFVEVVKCAGKNRKPGFADEIITLISKIYRVERDATVAGFDEMQRLEVRRLKSRPLMIELKSKLMGVLGKVPPKTQLGNAIAYTLKQWPKLEVFLDHGYVKLDTNDIENDIRPFVLGRKAWLFSGCPEGAKANAILYSMITTAKAAGWEPSKWLSHVFLHLPKATNVEDLMALLPTVKPESNASLN